MEDPGGEACWLVLSGFIRTTKKHPDWGAFFVVRMKGLEPKQYCYH